MCKLQVSLLCLVMLSTIPSFAMLVARYTRLASLQKQLPGMKRTFIRDNETQNILQQRTFISDSEESFLKELMPKPRFSWFSFFVGCGTSAGMVWLNAKYNIAQAIVNKLEEIDQKSTYRNLINMWKRIGEERSEDCKGNAMETSKCQDCAGHKPINPKPISKENL